MNDSILNMKETLALCNNNETLAQELISMLKTDLPRQKMILIDAFDRHDTRLLRDIVHQILGSCSYISLPNVKQTALALQTAIHNDDADLQAVKRDLIKAIDAVIMLH